MDIVKQTKRNMQWYFWISSVCLMAIGTLFHFLNEWTGNHFLTAWIAPVNESIWEHLKLLFFPGLFVIGATLIWGKKLLGTERYAGYFAAQGVGIATGTIEITMLYYSYYGIIGKDIAWLNIVIFLLACLWAQAIAVWGSGKAWSRNIWLRAAVTADLLLMAALFTCYTYAPPRIPFFMDPQNGSYGVSG